MTDTTVTHYKYDPFDPHSLPQNKIYTIFFGHSDTMWLGTPEGLTIFETKSEKFTRVTSAVVPGMPELRNVSAICEDEAGNLWIGNYEGELWKYTRKTGKFLLLEYQAKSESKVPIIKIYKDSKNVIWFGTPNGLRRLNGNLEKFNDIRFTHFQHTCFRQL